MPGRIIGVSKDSSGNPALRMALQTREQHIRREKATSNICTAQALLANMASFYAVYHGPQGIQQIAERIHRFASTFAQSIQSSSQFKLLNDRAFFDTVAVTNIKNMREFIKQAENQGCNLRVFNENTVTVAFDETVTVRDLISLSNIFSLNLSNESAVEKALQNAKLTFGANSKHPLARTSKFLTHKTFNSYHSETEMLRYLYKLQSKDLSLTSAMISLGSCTMKLNATSEMIPVTWNTVASIHPFVPVSQTKGYQQMFQELEKYLSNITGFAATSLQPNSGAQGEYAGLMAIKNYHVSKGNSHKNICLIPVSAHGTNPASAAMVGMKIQTVKCDEFGYIDLKDLAVQIEKAGDNLSCIMVTYPSTYGIYEEGIKTLCEMIHKAGGQVYMDGANMNAQVGLTSPGDIGADVCHLNLHKTFCIPHGGGGPGVGPICVAKHLAPFLPGHQVIPNGTAPGIGKKN